MPVKTHRVVGFSLVEAALSVLIVGGLFVAAINTYGAAKLGHVQVREQMLASTLAEGMVQEILMRPYADPNQVVVHGRESGEAVAADGARTQLDDIDDYHDLVDAPIRGRDGVALAGTEGWRRLVKVYRVDADDLTTESSSETGVKRITVTVMQDERLIATLEAFCSQAGTGSK